MLLPDNIHPKHSIYYNGSIVLRTLQNHGTKSIFDLYQSVKSQIDMTFSVFVLCLDWLYLLDIAELNSDGEVQLCS